ncbi:hypothetical protein BpHYR1_041846 [Brachionus plicatilis]|uniref:Uncharacterized protein n=1 Tax=Brachionus plicatilis TaxID=10195 RepID=A0A3M7QBE1_BRAPC|nr:hypothetical protein BpHYR1_041846 [Brachionus plicatilis]
MDQSEHGLGFLTLQLVLSMVFLFDEVKPKPIHLSMDCILTQFSIIYILNNTQRNIKNWFKSNERLSLND